MEKTSEILKSSYTLTITKSGFKSDDPNIEGLLNNKMFKKHFDKKKEELGSIEYYYLSNDGEKITYEKTGRQDPNALINLYRLALQIFYKKLEVLSDEELQNIQTAGEAVPKTGLWQNHEQIKKRWGNISNKGSGRSSVHEDFIQRYPATNSEDGFSFYAHTFYDVSIGCQELLKLFNDDGKFIVRYQRGSGDPINGHDEIDERSTNLSDSHSAKNPVNIIYYGVPGTGKSYRIEHEWGDNPQKNPRAINGQVVTEKTVFHPEYDNTDFVGQLLPVIDCETHQAPSVTYKFAPGPFARILAKAIIGDILDNDRQYNLIIEEINRGNASAIFGEIFQLLDREDSYEINNEQIADYVLSQISENIKNIDRDCKDKAVSKLEQGKVWLPNNMNIIASMNTSDQNVFTLDNAFQRRFEMRRLPNRFAENDKCGETMIAKTGITWGDFRNIINTQIEENDNSFSSEDRLLGPHFVTLSDLQGLNAFVGKVMKYLWQDVCRMQPELLFADDIKSLQGIYDKVEGGEFIEVFNEDIKKELDELANNDINQYSKEVEMDNESSE